MRIVYLGCKEFKSDNIAATGLVWTRGQIHEVEDAVKAAKLLEHPLIWADADKQYELIPELAAVAPEPRVHVIPANPPSPFWDPLVFPVPADVFSQLREKKLMAVFMTPEDSEAFADWKLERDTRPDPAPRVSDPYPKDEEPSDKRTREWKDWAARHGKAA